jgi:hypothetical protein
MSILSDKTKAALIKNQQFFISFSAFTPKYKIPRYQFNVCHLSEYFIGY